MENYAHSFITAVLFTAVTIVSAVAEGCFPFPARIDLALDFSTEVTTSICLKQLNKAQEALEYLHPNSTVSVLTYGANVDTVSSNMHPGTAQYFIGNMTCDNHMGTRDFAALLHHENQSGGGKEQSKMLIAFMEGASDPVATLAEAEKTNIKVFIFSFAETDFQELYLASTTKDHTFWFSRDDYINDKKTQTRLKDLICKDTNLKCPTDHFYDREHKECTPCNIICIPKSANNPGCHALCPYFKVSRPPITTTPRPEEKEEDEDDRTVLLAASVTTGITMMLLILITLAHWKYAGRWFWQKKRVEGSPTQETNGPEAEQLMNTRIEGTVPN